MSFSKAKLLRFNETKSCAPPPGAYDPKYKTPVVGAVIPKSERFIDPKSPTSSVCSDTHSTCSAKSAPQFNTPTIPTPRRKKLFLPLSNKKLNILEKEIQKKETFNPKICELESKIEELRLNINDLQEKLNETTLEKKLIQDELKKIQNDQTEKQNQIATKYQNEINDLNKNFDKILFENKISEEERLEELKARLTKQFNDELNGYEQKLSEIQLQLFSKTEELKNLENQLDESKKEILDLKANHLNEIRSLNELHKSEVQDLEYELLKSVAEWQKVVDNLQKDQTKKIQEILNEKANEIKKIQDNYSKIVNQNQMETEAQITQIKENCTEKIRLVEIQTEEKINEINVDWSHKLAEQEKKANEILKECQSISEFSIIQSELEKNQITSRLRSEKEILESENITLQEIISKLKNEMTQITLELKDVKENLATEKQNHNRTFEKAKIKQRSYELTLSKTHQAIEALKNRLLDSDRDVEQLKTEIEQTESLSISYESKISNLETQIENLHLAKNSLESENYRLKFEFQQNLISTEKVLHDKVDEIQKFADEKIFSLTEENLRLSNLSKETLDQLHDQQECIAKSKLMIEKATFELDELTNENLELTTKIEKMEKVFLENEVKKFDEMNKILKGKDDEILTLKKLVQDQNALIGPFRQQLELYEREKETLLNDKQSAEKEMKEMSLKHAEILGHQNKKQKIKYMVDLKKRNIELQESKKDLEEKVFKQSLLIDSLRHELKALKTKTDKKKKRRSRSLITDKENILSPVKTAQNNNSFKIDSPLKDRN